MTATPATVEVMTAAATGWLESLGRDQRAKAQLAFDDEAERRRFFYTPNERGGLPISEMDPPQWQRAMQLVASGLSRPAFNTATAIMGIEHALDAREGWLERPYPGRDDRSRFRDPELYFVTIFGEPGGEAPWGWRFGGHHVCLQYTIARGRVVSPTPTFFGSHPADLELHGGNVLRPLAGEEDLGRELVRALDGERRARAVIAAHAPQDIVTQNAPRIVDGMEPAPAWRMMGFEDSPGRLEGMRRERQRLGLTADDDLAVRLRPRPAGLPASEMTAAQRAILASLIRRYTERMPDDVAAEETRRLTGQALAEIHFAWAGGLERGEPHYYRLHGPRFLVEYDNTQDHVNHIHSVWRDPEGDFGADVLAQHYARSHAR